MKRRRREEKRKNSAGEGVPRVEDSSEGEGSDDKGHGEELKARADGGGEEEGVGGRAEDVVGDHLPAVLLADVLALVNLRKDQPRSQARRRRRRRVDLGIASEIGTEDAEKDDADEAGQEEHQDGGVDHGEPVDLLLENEMRKRKKGGGRVRKRRRIWRGTSPSCRSKKCSA